jgi:hypothetical protein
LNFFSYSKEGQKFINNWTSHKNNSIEIEKQNSLKVSGSELFIFLRVCTKGGRKFANHCTSGSHELEWTTGFHIGAPGCARGE